MSPIESVSNGIPQAVAARKGSQVRQHVRGNTIGYIEVELLNAQTGKPMHITAKVHPSSTVLELKNRIHKAYPDTDLLKTGLHTRQDGPLLDDDSVLGSLTSSSLLLVYPGDPGHQVGWTVMFLSQYIGSLLIYLVFYFRLAGVYDSTVTRRRHKVVHLACFCHSVHYIKHLLETLFVHRLSHGYTNIGNLAKGCSFYWGFTSWLGYYINHPLYTPTYHFHKQVISSLVCFLVCEWGNLCINRSLAQHKQTGNSVTCPRPTYNPFTWLSKLVHYPQYTYEIGAWMSFTIMTQTVPAAVFTAVVTTQMLMWAKRRRGRDLFRVKNPGSFWKTTVVPFLI